VSSLPTDQIALKLIYLLISTNRSGNTLASAAIRLQHAAFGDPLTEPEVVDTFRFIRGGYQGG
jgi:hypothetical protein